MATADEILSQLATEEDKVLVINNDLRTITIPQTVKMLGVESDEDVLRLHFRMPKTYGETDLSEFVIRINYINAKGIGDIYTVSDTSIVDDTITFSWLISRNATAYKGSVRFIVCLKLYDETGLLIKEYNTTVASLPVLEGLEVSDIVIEQNPDIIEKILLRLDKLENSGGVNVSGAQVGQTIRVSAVDESGKPTAWEASDFPEQIQSDYNQNDETAADYVKNRPFYDGGLKKELALTYSVFEYIGTASLYITQILVKQKKPMFEEGDKIFVEVNGNQFSDTIIMNSEFGQLCAGQVNEMLNNEFDKIEFCLVIVDDLDGNDTAYRYVLYCKLDSVENAIANIYREFTYVKQIDRKFLPNILINKKSLDADGNLNLVPDDIGAVQPVIIEVSGNGTASMSSSDVLKLIKKGANPILIYLDYIYTCNSAYLRTNSSENIEFIRIDMVHTDIDRDNYYLLMRKATLSGTQVTFLNYDEDIKLPFSGYSKPYQYVSVGSSRGILEYKDIEYKITLSRTDDGVWSCDKTMLEIEEALHYIKPYVYIEARNINALGYDIPLHGWFELPYIGVESAELEKYAYIFSGTYGDYNITVTIGPTNSSNVTVTVENINSLPTVTEADDGKFLRVSGNAYVLEALTDVSEVGA